MHIQARSFASAANADTMVIQHLFPSRDIAEPPFHAAWVQISPEGKSQVHQHHDAETWYIASGHGLLTIRSLRETKTQAVGPGDTVYLPPFTAHEVTNESATVALVFLTVYWEDFSLAARTAGQTSRLSRPKRVLVTAAPPTTNGDLHLGHISGPYLGADILARYLRLRGVDARFACGSDDHQSYVEAQALRSGLTAAEVSQQFSDAVSESLTVAGIEVAAFVRSGRRPDHQQRVAALFEKIYSSGHIERREMPCLHDPSSGRYVYEAFLQGTCPHCGRPCGGGACEDCCLPHDPTRMVDPRCTFTGERPVVRNVECLVLPLEKLRTPITQFVRHTPMSTRLRTIAEGMLASPLPDIPLTHPTDWGVPVPVPGFENHRIWAWFDMWVNYVSELEDVALLHGWPGTGGTRSLEPEIETVQFFGCDNAYYHVVLYPALSFAAWGKIPELRFVTNEFLLLDGKKFSTSRNHAIWVRDAFQPGRRDLLRFYLAHIRPEACQADFTQSAFNAYAESEFVQKWQQWFTHVGNRLQNFFAGRAPTPGLWTNEQTRFLVEITAMLADVRRAYEVASFSPPAVTRRLQEFVRRAQVFGCDDERWDQIPSGGDYLRAGVALELAAMRAFAIAVSPLMPDLADELWKDLGMTKTIDANGWEDDPGFIPAGTKVNIASSYFSSEDSDKSLRGGGAAEIKDQL